MLSRSIASQWTKAVAHQPCSAVRLLSSTTKALAFDDHFQRPAQRNRHQNRSQSKDPRAELQSDGRRPTFRSKITQRAQRTGTPPSLLTLADLSVGQLKGLIRQSLVCKAVGGGKKGAAGFLKSPLEKETVALIFSKRSTRTRVASESAINALGGGALFLGKDDIQLGVNESLEDSAKIIGSMTAGIMARVGDHSEVEILARDSGVPVINALSDLWHPTQILADILTMYEVLTPADQHPLASLDLTYRPEDEAHAMVAHIDPFDVLQGKKIVWVGDVNNVLNDMLVSLPRIGMTMAVAAPKGYDKIDERVWKRIEEAGMADKILVTNSPSEALKDADFVVTDTWISMGWESEKEARLKAFEGFQVTEKLCAEAGAKSDWKFLHCLPRKAEEVDDDVFYGPRSHVFQEGENRKWTIMACFSKLIGSWKI